MAPLCIGTLAFVLAFIAGASPEAATTGSLRGSASNATSTINSVSNESDTRSVAVRENVTAPYDETSNMTQGARFSYLMKNFSSVQPLSFRHRPAARAFVRGRGGGANCFPGVAEVMMKRKDEKHPVAVPIAQLQVGQEVLVEVDNMTAKFEPVLGFLHFAPAARGSFHTLVHSRGQLRATAEHIVFALNAHGHRVDMPMKDVRVGDQVLTVSEPGSAIVPSPVLAVREDTAMSAGMFAPLTASGSVVVDQTVASVYAGAAAYRSGPHAAYHALFFGARLFHYALEWLAPGGAAEAPLELHPAVQFFEVTLGPFFKTGVGKW